jgi:hypothetical protein
MRARNGEVKNRIFFPDQTTGSVQQHFVTKGGVSIVAGNGDGADSILIAVERLAPRLGHMGDVHNNGAPPASVATDDHAAEIGRAGMVVRSWLVPSAR